MDESPKIAILIPCHNEEVTIGKIVDDCCTDRTAEIADAHCSRGQQDRQML